ncbi:photoactive yellow protein [Rhodovulum sp. 12E13]|jgi:photoactive yellow protein|uniref:photoactive yellow protein n=1 Tax=Rhodovulum sp. 12E13 TaxID=2203891 RepID=UPI000B0FE1F8|nr:photoactive yellow protein [Rhodovulum sp. 12E13]RDC73058.1 photoactive yellow protein [Rhodovulum sp. 12E13]
MEIIPFGSQDVDNILAREPQRVEKLAFGAVLLDRNGKVVKYNQAEGLIAGRDPSEVVGKDFFNEIAPCAKGKRFHGEFLKFHQTGQVNVMFDYKFDYKGANVGVKIHLKSQPDGQHCWMFVKRA